MNKLKTLTLFSFYENGCRARIRMEVYRDGFFCHKGKIDIDREKSLKNAKRLAKRRGLGFHLISLVHEGCGYHHVNKRDVVAINKDIHNVVSHSLLDGSALRLEGVLG